MFPTFEELSPYSRVKELELQTLEDQIGIIKGSEEEIEDHQLPLLQKKNCRIITINFLCNSKYTHNLSFITNSATLASED